MRAVKSPRAAFVRLTPSNAPDSRIDFFIKSCTLIVILHFNSHTNI